MPKEVKPKPQSKENAAWKEALSVYQSEIEERESLLERLTEYRDGCTDGDWVVIHKAIEVMRGRIAKMQANHEQWSKKNAR